MPTFSDSEALILVDIIFTKDKSKSDGELSENMQIASVRFNNLDVVGEFFVRFLVIFCRIRLFDRNFDWFWF